MDTGTFWAPTSAPMRISKAIGWMLVICAVNIAWMPSASKRWRRTTWSSTSSKNVRDKKLSRPNCLPNSFRVFFFFSIGSFQNFKIKNRETTLHLDEWSPMQFQRMRSWRLATCIDQRMVLVRFRRQIGQNQRDTSRLGISTVERNWSFQTSSTGQRRIWN